MPIMTCAASKATPAKGLAYIMDPEKVLASGSQGLRSQDPERMAEQMIQTMHVHGKGWSQDERKYYHCKVSFDPRDLQSAGGILDEKLANRYAGKMAKKLWPGREVAWSVQHHGTAMHIHFIVGACEMATGKKLDARNSDYRKWKDYSQELAKEYGLSTLDWRKATKEKREQEIQSQDPVDETFAEQGLKARGKDSWKDELRGYIDEALRNSSSMDDFRENLKEKGVELTRCTEKTISYKLGEHRACRGDSLGGDYTAAAVWDALEHNRQDPVLQEGRKRSLDAQITSASTGNMGREIGQEERELLRDFGRLAGFKRSEIDAMCDRAPHVTWEEKQKAWADYKTAKAEFWDEYTIRNQEIQNEISEAYRLRRLAKQAEWALDPRNRRKSFFGIIVAAIYLRKNDDVVITEYRIENLKRQQEELRKEAAVFKNATENAVETLREKGLPLNEYIESVKYMQDMAEQLQRKNALLLDYDKEQLRRQAEARRRQHKNTPTR